MRRKGALRPSHCYARQAHKSVAVITARKRGRIIRRKAKAIFFNGGVYMSETVLQYYNSLSQVLKAEVDNYIMYLVQKQQNDNIPKKADSRIDALKSMSGVCSGILEGMDAVDFQNQIREYRVVG